MNLKVWARKMAGDAITPGPLPVFEKYVIGVHTFADCAVDAIETLLKKPKYEDELKDLREDINEAKRRINEGEDAERVFKETFEDI
jgi:hypothetical protein